MLFELLGMIPQPIAVVPDPPVPTISAVNITHFAGVCFNHSVTVGARVTVNWTETNYNASNHEHRIYQDDVLIATVGAGTSYQKQIPGVIEDGCGSSWQSNWTFRVDIVRKSDSVVLASGTASPHIWYYGTCCGNPQ